MSERRALSSLRRTRDLEIVLREHGAGRRLLARPVEAGGGTRQAASPASMLLTAGACLALNSVGIGFLIGLGLALAVQLGLRVDSSERRP